MDNPTHALVGLMLARVAATRDNAVPAWMMVVAANLPDADIVTWLRGSLNYLEYHRSYTHALAFAPLVAAVPVLLWRKLSLRLYVLSLIAVLSHLVLDWTNVYGIRMLLPFSSRWLRLDITDIVDPWILLILLLAIAAPALSRMVGSEIGARGSDPKRGWAWVALVALLSYEGARYAAHDRVLNVMGARLFNGAIARRVTALPFRFNPLQWRGVAEGDGFVAIVPVNLAENFDPSSGRIDYTASSSPAIDAARRTRPFEVFGMFSQLPFWRVTPVADGTKVELIDLRFGTPQAPSFEATAVVDASAGVHESQFSFGAPPVRTK